jgi:hypothetical protein
MIHLRLALAFAVVGFVFTSKLWLSLLHTLGPEQGLIVKWIAILSVVFFLDYADPTLKIEHKTQAIGVIMVLGAFNIIFNYQSEWIVESGAENIEIQSPDGALYHRARNMNLSPDVARILVFTVVPFILVLVGSKFIRNGRKLNIN